MGLSKLKLSLYIEFLLCILSRISVVQTTVNTLPDYSDLLKTLKSYEFIKPYRLQGEKKRYASTRNTQNGGHIEVTTLVFKGLKHHFILDIVLNKGLFSAEYTEHHVLHNGTRIKLKKIDHCFYHGTVRGLKTRSSVSLSTCEGIEGIIRTDKEVYYIKPLKSKEGNILDEHLVYNGNDKIEKSVFCGHSHKISLKDNFVDHTESKKRVRRNVNTETKYVELFLINDLLQYQKYGDQTELRSKQLANHLDSIYRRKKIRIALVLVETWKDRDLINVDANATKALANFIEYKTKKFGEHRGKHWDNVQLLTAKDFLGSTVGYAPIRSICGRRSAAVIQDHSDEAVTTASTMAHELGHNLGMVHDVDNCECPSTGSCIMSAYLSGSANQFSTCSLNSLRKTLEEGYGTCLFDEPDKLFGPALCQNGFVEEGEQCDCGTQEECEYEGNKCCNATTCMLHPEAVCSHGECCENCQYRPQGYLCREKRSEDECDLPEYCTGTKEMCPEDGYVHDGVPCEDKKGYCYKGVCRELTRQCKYLFGSGAREGGFCFNGNTNTDSKDKFSLNIYGCYNETEGKYICAKKDVKCGKLFCQVDKVKLPQKGQDRNYLSLRYKSGTICITPTVNVGDGQYLEYVQDGTKCGEDMMCKGGVCRPLHEGVPIPHWKRCPSNCSGNGVCNNNGNCHCHSGYACPDCKSKGLDSGGSRDSGQGCQTVAEKGGVNVAAAVLIPLFLIVLIAIIVLVYWKRREIRDRLNRYKLVRRTVGRSTSNADKARANRPLPQPKISGPTNIAFSSAPTDSPQQAKWRRQAPARPHVPPVDEPQPSPVKQPLRRPIPSQTAKEGHESVPLFPPSAAPQTQEPYKPRPVPPPIPKTQNTQAASKPLPGKPKLPPTRSYPELNPKTPLTTPAVEPKTNPPRPKPRLPPGSHRSVPDFPDDVPVPKPRNLPVRPGHQSVPLFNLPDSPDDSSDSVVRPSAVKANQPKPAPARRSPDKEDRPPVDFRAGLKPVPKPWNKV